MALQIGTDIGRYHILDQLGEGGMAIVYKAYDTNLDCEVAVKTVRLDRLIPQYKEKTLKRFRVEAKKMAQLDHPNILKVNDYGDYDEIPYLVMPFIHGGTLKELINNPLSWKDAFKLLIPIAEALDYAHEKGVIHRDVKPSNILITESGQPMLSDFGIAKVFDFEETRDLTTTLMGIGTVEYMAPELGMSHSFDHRIDIYSLGIILYEMLTGRKPFIADTPAAVLIKHISDPLPDPSQYNRNIPDSVKNILYKALAKNPENRFNSAGEFASALRKVLANQPFNDWKGEDGTSNKKKNLLWIPIAAGLIAIFLGSYFLLRPNSNIQGMFNQSEESISEPVSSSGGNQEKITDIVIDATSTATPTQPIPTSEPISSTSVNNGVNNPDCTNEAEMVSETVPDGTLYEPFAKFTKTWTVKNTGTCTWNSGYHLIYDTGDQMSGDGYKVLNSVVSPGEEVEISLDLTAPNWGGTCMGYWQLQSDTGTKFYRLYTIIRVNLPAGKYK